MLAEPGKSAPPSNMNYRTSTKLNALSGKDLYASRLELSKNFLAKIEWHKKRLIRRESMLLYDVTLLTRASLKLITAKTPKMAKFSKKIRNRTMRLRLIALLALVNTRQNIGILTVYYSRFHLRTDGWLDYEMVDGTRVLVDRREIRINSREFKSYVQNLPPLTPFLFDMIIGKILGDATLKGISQGGCKFSFIHAVKYADYLFHIYDLLHEYVGSPPTITISSFQKGRYKKLYYKVSFSTYTCKAFMPLLSVMYCNKPGTNKYIKYVPENIAEFLTPVALAYWYMDDGNGGHLTKGNHRGPYKLSTNSFTLEDVTRLANALESRHNIPMYLAEREKTKKGNRTWAILTKGGQTFRIFADVVRPYMIPILLYKL